MADQDFDAQVSSMPIDELNALFETATPGTPNADDLNLGKEVVIKTDDVLVPELTDTKSLFEDDTKTAEELAKEKTEAEEKQKTEDEEKAKKEQEEKDKNKSVEELAKEKETKDAEDKKKAEEAAKLKEDEDLKAKADSPEVKEVLKNTVAYLVKSGQWEEFEGREDMEITEELYAKLAAQQDEYRLSQKFDQLVDSTGDYGKAILAHIKNGGNPDDVIDIFKEQQQTQSIDTSTEQGKEKLIEKYYKEVVGWKADKIERHIKRLVTDNEVETEFTEVEEEFNKHYKARLADLDREAKAEAKKVEEKKLDFKNNIKDALEKEETLTPKERKAIEQSILDFKHDLGNGQKVNDFYIKFAEMQKDPKKYIQLVRFVMNPANYEKAIEEKKETAAAKNTFKFVKGNAAVTKTTTAEDTTGKNKDSKTQQGTNFSFAFTKNR